jgi:hypothetical protein
MRCLRVPGLLVALVLAGCGGGDGSSSTTAPARAKSADFPAAAGKTLKTLRGSLPGGLNLAPSTTASLRTGKNRVGAALFTDDKRFVGDAQVALYTTDDDGGNVRGPYVARYEPMAPKTQFRSRTTDADLASAAGVYVADVPIPAAGKRVITGIARRNGRLYQTTGFELPIPRRGAGPVADVGDRPPAIHTQTLTDVGGDASKISTRVPPAKDLLQTDFADVLGKKPVVLAFATPQLCQSRVCGPVVDIVEQVKSQTKGDVAFIHQEIYNDNNPSQGEREQVRAFRLPSEPWTFVIGKDGRIAARFEGAVGVDELQRAVDAVAAKS